MCAREADCAARESCADEADSATGKLDTCEVAAVKDGISEVKIQAAPVPHCGGASVIGLQVGSDDADDGTPHLAGGPERLLFRFGRFRDRGCGVRHSKEGAQHIDTGL